MNKRDEMAFSRNMMILRKVANNIEETYETFGNAVSSNMIHIDIDADSLSNITISNGSYQYPISEIKSYDAN